MKKNKPTSLPDEVDRRSAGDSPRGSAGAEARRRLRPIIEAAEQAASGIIDDAEAQARQYLEEARRRADRAEEERAREMTALTDDLIARAQTVKGQLDDLQHALAEARLRVERSLPAAPADGPSTPVAADGARQLLEASVRLLATQMAVLGSSREEIASRLHTEYGIEEPEAILESVLGSDA